MVKVLSIDIGFKNPAFVLTDFNNFVMKFQIFNSVIFKKIEDSISLLEYFLTQGLDLVLIEKQVNGKNLNFMRFIQGFFLARNIKVEIKNPISYLLKEKNKSRKVKKEYSIELLTKFLKSKNIDTSFNADVSDAINIILHHFKNEEIKEIQFL